jgi:hypothetical protein
MTTTVDLLAVVCAHLADFELSAIASVHVSAALSAPQVTAQLARRELSGTAQGLLAWADTLTQVTAQAWQVPRGNSVRLSVTGRLPGDALVLVYGGLWATHRALGTDLPLDATRTIPLPTLRHAAIVVEEASA